MGVEGRGGGMRPLHSLYQLSHRPVTSHSVKHPGKPGRDYLRHVRTEEHKIKESTSQPFFSPVLTVVTQERIFGKEPLVIVAAHPFTLTYYIPPKRKRK